MSWEMISRIFFKVWVNVYMMGKFLDYKIWVSFRKDFKEELRMWEMYIVIEGNKNGDIEEYR